MSESAGTAVSSGSAPPVGFAREVADRVVFMDGGRIVEQGPPDEVLDHPRHERTRDFLSKVL